jgi:serine/threonine-protein kinase
MRRSLLVGGALGAILITGCATDPQPVRVAASERFAGFAGVVKETDNYLGIAVLDGRARAFVCDQNDEAWFEGTVAKDGIVTLTAAGGKQRVGFFNTLQGMGAFWIGGRLRTFQAAPVDKSAGLYRAQSANGQLVGGWVVLPNGDQVGAVTRNGVNQPAPRITPGEKTVTVDGEQLPLKSGIEQLSDDSG